MDIDEFKDQIEGLLEFRGIPPGDYADNSILKTWDELAQRLKDDARFYSELASKLAGYAGVATKKSKAGSGQEVIMCVNVAAGIAILYAGSEAPAN